MEHLCYLVKELESFVKFRATMFARAPLEPRKAIGLVLYQFANYWVGVISIVLEYLLLGSRQNNKWGPI